MDQLDAENKLKWIATIETAKAPDSKVLLRCFAVRSTLRLRVFIGESNHIGDLKRASDAFECC